MGVLGREWNPVLRSQQFTPGKRDEMKTLKHLTVAAAITTIGAIGCAPVRPNLPPEQRLLQPGPGVGGPGPGVLGAPPAFGGPGGPGGPGFPSGLPSGGPGFPIGPASSPAISPPLIGTHAAAGPGNGGIEQVSHRCGCGSGCGLGSGCLSGLGSAGSSNIPAGGGVIMGGVPMGVAAAPATVQVTFGNPDGMQVVYDATGAGMFDSTPLVAPARQNFPQGGLYRLKLTNIPTRPGVELYPTVELAYANPRTGAYLAHNSVPVQFTEEDFDQVLTGNFVTKVIYLPDPDFQGPALAGIDTLVSTRLDPGIDPIAEADRRGSILSIIRLGDKDIEMAGADGSFASGGYMSPPIAGLPAPFAPAMTEGCGNGGPGVASPPGLPGMIAGVNAPQYGMPITGTPIGLPGPPHIPLGAPAGLKKHVIRNRTQVNIPRPVEKVKMNVRLQPGYSYPQPASRVNITEQNIHPGSASPRGLFRNASQQVDPNHQP